ncbi:MAG: hypothetical protein ACK4GL_11320 [Flavobacteriales bacterium]
MDELNKLWQSRKDDDPIPEINASQLHLKNASESPLKKLKRNFQANLILAIVFTIMFIVLFILLDGLWLRLFTGVLIIGYILITFQTIAAYRKYLGKIKTDDQVKVHLKSVFDGITQMLRMQEFIAIFFYPIAIVSGFLMALYQQNGMHAFNNSFTWVLLGVLIIVFTPLCYYLAKYLNKIAFGRSLREINALLDGFEKENGE